jgi:hypothetical protein
MDRLQYPLGFARRHRLLRELPLDQRSAVRAPSSRFDGVTCGTRNITIVVTPLTAASRPIGSAPEAS